VASAMKTLTGLNRIRNALPFTSMVHVDAHVDGHVQRNADARWNTFSSQDYLERNYHELQAEDEEIIRRVSQFFTAAFKGRPGARRGIDVGSGPNLYPALLMLPWTEQILLTDFAVSNVHNLRAQLADYGAAWAWQPFWDVLREAERYNEIDNPRKHLQVACHDEPGFAGIEQGSVFSLPEARWDLGTMFFVAESITEDRGEFHAALARFVRALKPGAPFATAFMAGSDGYLVADTKFPALPITPGDVRRDFTELGVGELSVEHLLTEHRVRDGYEAMIVATGVVRDS
jgi:NNMT/PNMT/TEMT family